MRVKVSLRGRSSFAVKKRMREASESLYTTKRVGQFFVATDRRGRCRDGRGGGGRALRRVGPVLMRSQWKGSCISHRSGPHLCVLMVGFFFFFKQHIFSEGKDWELYLLLLL